MQRRTFFTSPGGHVCRYGSDGRAPGNCRSGIAKMKITRVRAYTPPNPNPLFNQSDMVVTIETDAGITGVGEGGSKGSCLEQCAGRLIGRDPHYIEKLWQDMSRSFFYPARPRKGRRVGRARSGALGSEREGAWNLPVHALLRRHGAELLRVLQHSGDHSGRPTLA